MTAAIQRPLLSDHADLLREGLPRGHRSEAVWSVTLGMVNAGWQFSDFMDAFHDPRNGLSDYFRAKPNGRLLSPPTRLQRLHRTWRRAESWVQDHPAVSGRAEARQEIGLLIADAYAQPERPYEQAVLLSLLSIASRCGRLDPTASERQIAEAAGLPKTTVHRVLARLVETGHLSRTGGTRRAGEAPRWRLLKPASQRTTRHLTTGVGLLVRSDAPSDLWAAWGQHARAIYRGLDEVQPQRAVDIAAVSNTSRRTVERWLAEFLAVDLAQRDDTRYLRGAADPDEVARQHGEAGRLDLRRLRHQSDRQGYPAALQHAGSQRETVDPNLPVQSARVRWKTDAGPAEARL